MDRTIEADNGEEQDVPNVKSLRCNNRCKFRFFPVKTEQIATDENTVVDKVLGGISLCQTCGFSEDMEFD